MRGCKKQPLFSLLAGIFVGFLIIAQFPVADFQPCADIERVLTAVVVVLRPGIVPGAEAALAHGVLPRCIPLILGTEVAQGIGPPA